MFPPSQREQNSLSQLTHIPQCPALLPLRNQPFSQQLFFPCSPFREPIWGIEAIKPAENEKITLWEVKKKKKKSIQWAQCTSQFNHTIVSNSCLCISLFKQLSPSTNNSPFSVTIHWSVTWCFLSFRKQWANRKAERLYLQFLLWLMCECEWLVWPRGKHTTCHSG